MMGTIFAIVSIVAAIALVRLPEATVELFAMLTVMLVALVLAASVRARPGLISTATVLCTSAVMLTSPFSITRQHFNQLNRAARQGDAAAEPLIAFYGTLQPYSPFLMLLLVAVIAGSLVFAARHAPEGGSAFMLSESEALARLTSRIGVVAALLYVPMILIIVYDVFQRKYLDIDPDFTRTAWYQLFTSTRLQEMEWHLHAVLFLACLGFAYVRDAHVRIELVSERLRPRTRVWIELLGCFLFLLPYCYVVVLYGFDLARNSFNILERSSAQTGLEYRFIIKSFLPFGFLLLALAGVSVALKCIVYLFGPGALQGASGSYADVHHGGMPEVKLPPAAESAI
jgi:TRAP-type mannitol/chloroaromatic compound transport system permease small subunit